MKLPRNLKRKTLIGALMTALSAPVYADSFDNEPELDWPEAAASPQEGVGTGTGAVVGGLVAGPPGFIVGAIGGNLFGRHMSLEDQLEDSEANLHRSRTELAQTRRELARTRTMLARTERELEQQRQAARERERGTLVASTGNVALGTTEDPVKAIHEGFAMTVQFRTDSDAIEPHFRDQLKQLAEALEELPNLRARLQGFADPRGEEGYNLELSRKRVEAVERVLTEHGVDPSRVRVAAHGESQPLFAEASGENLDFERRVLITFER